MEQEFNLEGYLSNGVESIVKDAIKATLTNPRQSIFMAKYALSSKKARKLREEGEKNGEHIPPFLIASITSQCNLHCAGCYARENHACWDKEAKDQLTDAQWELIFEDAKNIGIGFILLAGGEPLLRPNIIKIAGKFQEIIFPIFTNGTMIQEEYIKIFAKHRNLIPILSIEGNERITDHRRGTGVYQMLIQAMDTLDRNNILFGASITVTKNNIIEVTSQEFLDKLSKRGCKVVFYVEYVPINKDSIQLAPGDQERKYLEETLLELRHCYDEMLFISFPGDEKTSGGCLAAGRGFFHINSNGGAEPCPFSPYSDTNLKNTSLRGALNSPLFRKLRDNDILMEEHVGGCVLFEKKETVMSFLEE